MGRWALVAGGAAGVFDVMNDQVLSRSVIGVAAAVRIGLLYKYSDPQTLAELSALHAQAADLLVRTLLRNEGLYIKFGQGMSSLNHVMPPEFTSRLQVLLDHAPTTPVSDVLRTIAEDFGRPASSVFVRFDEEPIAAASIAQVHRATIRLPNGELQEVAVKVLKPRIKRQVWWDLTVHDFVCFGLEQAFGLRLTWAANTIRENMTREVDFRNEYNYTETGRRVWSHRDDVVIPRLFANYCTARVLVTEWMDATKLVDVAAVKANFDVTAAMRTLMETYGEGLFRNGFVHADPHPANVLIRKDPKRKGKQQIVLLDFGLCVQTSEEFRKDYALLWKSIFTHDMQTLERVVKNWGIGNAELFASFQLQRPFSRSSPIHAKGEVTKEDVRHFQAQMKKNVNNMLEDDARVPRELVFVGRGAQLLRSINKTYGAPVNRANIFASKAVESLDGNDTAGGGRRRWLSLEVARYEFTLFTLALAHAWSTWCNWALAFIFTSYRVSTLEDVMETNEKSFVMRHSHRFDVSVND